MGKFTGVVKKNALEGGFWELHTDGGDRFQLEGGDATLLKEGARVEVDGKIDKRALGIGMTGPILAVKALKQL